MTALPLRHARQYVLREIGTDGQARIEAACVRAGDGDPRATEIALAYLERAGMRITTSGTAVLVASGAELARIAGRPELAEAAAFLAGALSATAHLARVAGVEAVPVARVPALCDDRA